MYFLYALISKKTGLPQEEIKKLVENKIKQFEGLITEDVALILVAKDLGIDVSEIISSKRIKIEYLTSGLRNVELSVKILRKVFETDKNIVFEVCDETGTAYLICWENAKEKAKEFKEGDIIRVKAERVKEGKKGYLELHINKSENIEKEKDKKIIEVLSEIKVKRKIIETIVFSFGNVLITLKGRILKTEDYLEPGKFYHIRAIKEDNKVKIEKAEEIDYEKKIKRLLTSFST